MRTVRIAAIALAVSMPLAAQNFDDVEITSTHVAGNVHMLMGQGGNIGVSAGEDGVLIVDDQFASLADKIKAALQSIDRGKLEYVLNTHFHGDHTGGNSVFGLEALIVAHNNVRARLSKEQTNRNGRVTPPAPPAALPVITFDEGLSIYFNGEEIEMTHVANGHTDGDSIIYFKDSKVLHMGDHFFNSRFPFVDLGSGGTVQGMTRNVEMVLREFKNVKGLTLIPGHGALADLDTLATTHRMLKESVGTVQKGIDSGKSLDEIKKAGLSDEWDGWGSGFITTEVWIETVHSSLQ